MSLRINNYLGQTSVNNIRQSNKGLSSSLEKISSGRRINRASDDASGMIIANSLNSQVRGLGQSIRNANDSIAMVQIADGALHESTNIIHQIKEKAIQASSAAQSSESRQAIQADISKMISSLEEISGNTSYNGQNLLSGSFTDKKNQIGPEAGQTIDISIASASPEKLGDSELGNLSDINVLTFDGAQDAIAIADAALTDINQIRSDLGSSQNQFESTINNLTTTSINIQAAESQINDVDFAEETMTLARMKVLAKAQAFATAQAGKINESQITSLLQG